MSSTEGTGFRRGVIAAMIVMAVAVPVIIETSTSSEVSAGNVGAESHPVSPS